ncbi:MAG: undecaprenyl-diphosphate phosphatase [Akkermansia sp.]|nr:undecaprenyl-diphosphate phosphatase [Akkermansia sp.]
MTILESLILGLVEGLTEYLPVSSTGHLIIAQYLLGLPESDAMHAFEICIQGGAILAVLGLYFRRVREMVHGLAGGVLALLGRYWGRARRMSQSVGQNPAGLRMMWNMLLGFIPAAVIGVICSDYIKGYLFNATTVMVMWVVGGVVILLYVRQRRNHAGMGKELSQLTWRGALVVGLMQCIAMIPGTSRSLMTMLGGLTVGLSVAAAVEFSFLLGLITLGAATVHDAYKYGGDMVASIGWGPIIAGSVMAWFSSVIAVRWMVGYLNRHSLSLFGWYRIAAGAVMLGLILCGLEVSREDEPAKAPEPAAVVKS